MSICKDVVDEAWSDPAFLAEQKRVCGENNEFVFPHTRKNGVRVKGHCRNFHAPRPRAKKAKKVDPRQKKLAALLRRRDAAGDLATYAALNRQAKALRAEMRPEPVQKEPDDISGFDFTSVRPRPPKRVSRTPMPAGDDSSDDESSSPRHQRSKRTPTLFTKAIRDYIASLPRGEQRRAENTIRLYMVGPAKLGATEALARFGERRGRDAQAPVGDTAFDDSGEEDEDLGGFGAGLPEGYHVMPDGQVMADSAHLVGQGYMIV